MAAERDGDHVTTIVRQTIVQVVEETGYEVLSADDGKRGMVVFRRKQPDLVITDIIMPEQEGIQTYYRDAQGQARREDHRHLRRWAHQQHPLSQDRPS
jgi:CheY-like chemotaxis protein